MSLHAVLEHLLKIAAQNRDALRAPFLATQIGIAQAIRRSRPMVSRWVRTLLQARFIEHSLRSADGFSKRKRQHTYKITPDGISHLSELTSVRGRGLDLRIAGPPARRR